MADRVSYYYESLNPEVQSGAEAEPFAVLPSSQDFQFSPIYPAKVQAALGFAPPRNLAWNAIQELTLEIAEGGDESESASGLARVPLEFARRDYGAATGFTYVETWSGQATEGGATYEAVVKAMDFTSFSVTLTVTGNGATTNYAGEGILYGGLITVLLESEGGQTLTASLDYMAVMTSAGDQPLKYFAYYGTDTGTRIITYLWYKTQYPSCGELHQEMHIVPDGDALPSVTPPSMGTKWEGAWVPELPTVVTQDGTYEWVLTAKPSVSLSIDWGLEGVSETTTVTGFVWSHAFPAIDVPEAVTTTAKQRKLTLQGIFLVKSGLADKRVYNTDAQPCDTLTERIHTVPGYSLVAKWLPSETIVNDVEGLRKLVGAMPSPFASLPTARTAIPSASNVGESDLSIEGGFGATFSLPLSSGGAAITRQTVNALGHIGTQAQFFEQCGGYYTFDRDFAAAIGGYPEGAILQFYQDSTQSLRTVRSLKNDNLVNFLEVGVDGINWAYAGDRPVVNVKVDYSSFEDLSERLFVETGIPDLYEVPYDSYLQAFAVGSVDCDSLYRSPAEDVVKLYVDNLAKSQYHVRINGLYFANGNGASYLDIYHGDSQSFGSLLMGGFHPVTQLVWGGSSNVHHAVRSCPLSSFSCGVMLSKGDKIRVRNTISEKNGIVEMPTGDNNFVHPKVHGDDTLVRKYNYRFAALYKRGLVP